jgi:hypothetical protein
MALTLERQRGDARILCIGATASLAAGAMHVAAIAPHSEHRQAVWAFLGVALVQLVWGAAAVARPRRWLAAVGIVVGAAAAAGWVLGATRGIPLVDGLDTVQPVRFADGLAAALAGVTVVSCAMALVIHRRVMPRLVAGVAVVAVIALGMPGTVAALNHRHPTTGASVRVVERASAVPPRPFDPTLPINLGGVPGVTPQQQARAENLLAATVMLLPQWSDPAYDVAHGFVSIGDGVTGVEHYVSQAFMADDTILNPDKPESLVFDTTVTPKKLVAAMYMLKPGTTLADAPDIGGPLTQFHIHNNLCFDAQSHVAGLTQGNGTCPAALVKGPETPMIHVWITPRQCGPFAALEGIGGGQIKQGEAVACDHVHGAA